VSRPIAVRICTLVFALLFGVVLAGCSAMSGGSGTERKLQDFSLVAYQGQSVIGECTTQFSRVVSQGKPVVLNFWAGQCPPCRAEMPAFQRVFDEYQGRVQVIGLDVGDFTGLGTQDDARQLLQELHITYPTAYALDANPLQLYNVRAMPTTIFFTADGSVQEQVAGLLQEDRLRSSVQKLVAPQ